MTTNIYIYIYIQAGRRWNKFDFLVAESALLSIFIMKIHILIHLDKKKSLLTNHGSNRKDLKNVQGAKIPMNLKNLSLLASTYTFLRGKITNELSKAGKKYHNCWMGLIDITYTVKIPIYPSARKITPSSPLTHITLVSC